MKSFVIATSPSQMAELCARVRSYSDQVEAIAISDDIASSATADKIWHIPTQDGALAGDYAASVSKIVESAQPDAIFVADSIDAKLLCGRLAALLGTSAICDATEIADDVATHMVYGGAALRQDKAAGDVAIYLVNPFALPTAEAAGSNESVTAEFVPATAGIKLVSTQPREKSSVNLSAADRVVAVGRGLASQDDLAMIGQLATAIGAEVGCTRPIAEEQKWLPREVYIGVSGEMLAPDVYVAIGLSGQVQHMVGANRSKTIFAINKDKNAPIFKYADYGIVGDLYKIVPALLEKL